VTPPAPNPNLILPIGTQVVALVEVRGPDGKPAHPRGALGIVIRSPADYWHTYRVRFPDTFEANFKRQDLAVLTHYQNHAIGGSNEPLAEYNLYDRVIYRCVIGSRAYGLEGEDSDTDRRGVYLPPADLHWSLYGVPEQLENPQTEETYWEIQKFLTMALKANPNVLECLYSPIVEHATPLAQEMLAMRQSFLSTMVYQTYNGYVMSQFKKLQADLRNKGQVKWKHVMHLIRILISGVTVLREGHVPVRVQEHRERLLAIKCGEVAFEEVEAWRLALHREFDEAARTTRLPERPDYATANALLLQARRSMVSGNSHAD
jgi:predicted nucleotidyltransferase